MATQPTTGGFSLFPNPNASAGPSRHGTPRPRATTPMGSSREHLPVDASPSTASPQRRARQGGAGVERKHSTKEGKQAEPTAHGSSNGNVSNGSSNGSGSGGSNPPARGDALPPLKTVWSEDVAFEIIQRPAPAAVVDAPPRCDTAFSEAQTLVRSSSNRSRSSTTKAGPSSASPRPQEQQQQQPALRSIFPVYNHALPLERQEYYPTQTNPTHIPRGAINRPLYSPPPESLSSPRQHHQPTQQRAPSPQPHQYHAQSTSYAEHQSQHQQHQQQQQQQQQRQQQQQQQQQQQLYYQQLQLQQHQPQPYERHQPPSVAGGAAASVAAPSAYTGPSVARWPPRGHEQPVTPPISTTEELRGLWKVVSGWKATGSEGRVYCLKMTAERDTPIYTLSSSTQPFYNLRIDPTSVSAYVTLSRHDPAKTYRPPAAAAANSAAPSSPTDLASPGDEPTQQPASVVGTGRKDGKRWVEALSTTLEEASRRHAPNDGLVALLYPTAAARVVLERPDDAATIETAERECARLVWDDDTGNHYLVHPALAMPFCVTVDRNAAWSRTEYTLEHLESPQHIARLTRDGTGNGWLEVDTGIAGKIESVYLVEVAVAALMLVAHGDTQFVRSEVFQPPPVMIFGPPPGSTLDGPAAKKKKTSVFGGGGGGGGRDSRASGKSARNKTRAGGPAAAAAGGRKAASRMDEFELDLESQTSELKKLDVGDKDKKLPGLARGIIKLLSIIFKCFIWILTACFKALTGCISLSARCLTSEKL